jgi:hypothetical protein
VGQRSVSPKGGLRENHKIRWPKIMSETQLNAWYERVDKIRRGESAPAPKRAFLTDDLHPRLRLVLPS